MLERIGRTFESFVRRFMPDPFVLAIALTVLVFVLALCLSAHSFEALLDMWFNGVKNDNTKSGLWGLIDFSMQMTLVVVTGEAVAAAPLVRRGLSALATIPKTAFGSAAFVSLVAMTLGWLHWGFGLIAASLLAREVAAQAKSRGVKIHYPLIGAAAYTAQLIWHGGLSGSAPLKMNEANNFFVKMTNGPVGLSQTVLTPMNLIACGLLLVIVPFLIAAMTPKPENCVEVSEEACVAGRTPAPVEIDRSTFAGMIDASPVSSWALVFLGASYLYFRITAKKFALTPDMLNFIFLLLGLALHGSPVAYMKAAAQSMKGAAGIVIQFPIYFGIMGVMLGSGLSDKIAGAFKHLATARTLPFYTYACSVLSKLFIPSGGGEWAVEGPVMLQAAQELGANTGKTIMAVAYGNMVGNMFQPFWALPLLGIMGLKAKDIMGYCLVIFCVACPILGAILLLFS